MNIFITGASGYIGHALAHKLLENGKNVTVYTRSEVLFPAAYEHQITVRFGELLDRGAMEKAMEGCTQVYHLAACAKVWSKDPGEFDRINVDATKQLLQIAKEKQVEKVVVTSTAGVIGPSLSGVPLNESSEREMSFFNAYERTKHKAEEVCRAYVRDGLPVVIVNPSRVYGVGTATQSNAISRLIHLVQSGKLRFIPGDGTKTGNYVFLDDVVNGHLEAMEKGRSGERYLLGGINSTYDEFFGLIQQELGSKNRLFHLPVPLMMAFARFEKLKAELTHRPPMITPAWARKYKYHWPLNSSKAIKELNYSITPLQEGLRKTIKSISNE